MKNRIGYVSNSSSSSFILAFKKEVSPEHLADIFKTSNEYLEGISKYLAEVIMDNAEEITCIEKILSDNYADSVESLSEPTQKAIQLLEKEKYKVFYGYIPSYGEGGNPLEHFLSGKKIEHTDDKLYFYNEGGY